MKTKQEKTSTLRIHETACLKTNLTPAQVKFAISIKTVTNKENPSCLARVVFYSQNKNTVKTSWLNSINFGESVVKTPT